MYVCIYIYIYIYTHTHVHIPAYRCLYIYIYIYISYVGEDVKTHLKFEASYIRDMYDKHA